MLKRITSIGLLVVFLFNATGVFKVCFFISGKKANKKLRQEQLRQGDLVVVLLKKRDDSLATRGFKQLEKDEYLYHGHRYDVIKREKEVNKTVIRFAHDSYEEELLTFLKSFFSNRFTDPSAQAFSKVKHIIVKHYFSGQIMQRAYYALKYIFEYCPILHPAKPFQEIPLPPPKNI